MKRLLFFLPKKTTEYTIGFATFNIANSAGDAKYKPLDEERLREIIKEMNKVKGKVSVFALLEAGRAGWATKAAAIAEGTGYLYHSCHLLNATPMSFGKALFYDPERVAIHHVVQTWLDMDDPDNWGGAYFGNSILLIHVQPVVDQKIVLDATIRFAAVHFPLGLKDRLEAAAWVAYHGGFAEVWSGDFNTFEDEGGPEMIEIITKNGLKKTTPQGAITFRAFEHDKVPKSVDVIPTLNELSTYVPHPDDPTKILVNYAGGLDHTFVDPNLECKTVVCPLTDASDHALIYSEVTFSSV